MNAKDANEFTAILESDLSSGAIDRVVGFFEYNQELYSLVDRLVTSEKFIVRLGITVVLERLQEIKPELARLALPAILPLLESDQPTVRGDAANLVGSLGSERHVPALEPLLQDSNDQVAEIAGEAIEEIRIRVSK